MDSSRDDDFAHDITPVEWKTPLGETFTMSDTMTTAEVITYQLITGKIDITSACTADLNEITSGLQQLVLMVVKGTNPALHMKFDAIMENNIHISDINLNCESSK